MNTELARLLTTALVQFVDKNQPKDKMCVSSIEAEELERVFTEEKFDRLEDWYAYRMKPELTEFEKCMLDYAKARAEYEFDYTKVVELNDKVIELTKSYAKTLLALAKEQNLSYADESNPKTQTTTSPLLQGCIGVKGDPDPAGIWRPSEEQMEALEDSIRLDKTVFRKKKLESLLEELKKLKKE